MKNLEGQFKLGAALKRVQKERLTKIIDSFFHATDRHTRVNFCDYMNFYGVNAMFRENKNGRVYGLTFIDNRKGAVFNGSDLGKAYSGQTLIKRLDGAIAVGRISGEREREERVEQESEQLQLEGYNNSQPNWKLDIPKEIFDLMKAEKCYPGPMNPLPKRRKKPKRRKSI